MSYAQLSLADFAAAVGERTPSPASGSAIAVAAALAAALVELTARFSDDEPTVREAVGRRERLLELADEDAEAYAEFMRTRTAESKDRTVDVPLEIAEQAAEVARLGEQMEREGNRNLVGDAAAATVLARAALRAAAALVELNLGGADEPRAARVRDLRAQV
jgi:methenyltetrahydrofolate cyclohydrolase